MSTPLQSIPSLIPPPKHHQSQFSRPSHPNSPPTKSLIDDPDVDRFAALFSPATPPASPILGGGGTPAMPFVTQRTPHRSHMSMDSEFGSFVSVPPTQDPLSFSFASLDPEPTDQSRSETKHTDACTVGTPASGESISSAQSGVNSNTTLDYFDQFTSTAKTSSERNKRGVLDELLQHEDDPLYWIHSSSKAVLSGSVPSGRGHGPSKPHSQRPASQSPSHSSHSPRLTASPLPLSQSASSLPLSSSPPPVRPSSPPSTLSRLSSSWVSAFLPSARARSSTNATASFPPSSTTIATSSAHSTISHHSHTLPHSSVAEITHGTPFGSTPYTAPSGAPGFAGDHAWDKGFSDSFEREKDRAEKKSVHLSGRREGTADILSVEVADKIRSYLPALTRLSRTWTLLYSLDQHGISLNTLYTRCEPKPWNAPGATKGALVVIKDTGDTLFGAWMSEGLHLSKGAYYGSGESFLWKYDASNPTGCLDVYKWTARNDYVALCEPEYISFGGGDGHYGLYLDASLLDGSSAPCPTFTNDVLCSQGGGIGIRKGASVTFECVGLEVWGVGPG
ncbi:TLD-domain-containing protein [Hygrophoropsis aurantiaca]|uniref:TLD-domain-containing protein n=1 Tax=Hygrophoropsis aurantiaca TaxID=72124 RepID=A0ACB8A595_9AGAM|nr:TLD-domain-containing protein [Hygrophoropsis aurantiaca]